MFLKNRLRPIFKRAFFFAIYYVGILHLFIVVQTKLRKKHRTVILFYHRFHSETSDNYHLPYMDIRGFKREMRHIKRWYTVTTMDELAKRLAIQEDFTSPSIIITIDDGYLNNYNMAYPALKELDLPAMIYLTTGSIGTNNGLWVDDLRNILARTKGKSICVPEILGNEVLDILTPSQKGDAMLKLFHAMLHLEHQRKMLTMEKISQILGVNEVYKRNGERKMLNWDEVMEMSKNNISFGAHTVNHPTLSKMELREAKREIIESKIEIESRIGSKVWHFAIPNGKEEDFNEELKRYCKEIGLKTVASTEPGVVSTQSDPYFLKRINPPLPIYIFACEIARYIFL